MSLLPLLLESTLKASLVMLAALVAIGFVRHRSAALRHWILSAAILAATAAPLLGPVVPTWHVPLNALRGTRALTAPVSAPKELAPRSTPARSERIRPQSTAGLPLAGVGTFVATAWMIGVAIGTLILIVGLARLAWVASSSRRVASGRWAVAAEDISREFGLRRPVILLQSDHPTLLVTWGFVQPKVILPANADHWTDARIRIVLSHELAHVKRGDWLIQMVAEVARAGYWFNPVMWIACRRLRLESEQATDDLVLRAGIDGSDYAAHLLDLARAFSRHRPWLPAPAIARPSSLERRVSAMLNAHVNRTPITRTARLGIVAALSAIAIVVASAQGAFSTFSGTVFDPLNGYLPDVTMTLTNTQNGAKHEIHSDRTGHFEFVGLPPGSYTLKALLPGFSVLTGTLDLTGRDVQRDVTLRVGQLQETISVRASRGDASATPAPRPRRPAPDKTEPMTTCSDRASSAGSMGGNLRQPMKLVDVKPIYPSALADAGVGGVLEFAARIGVDGTITDLQTTSGANPDLELAAGNAIRQWQFTPTLLNCVAIEVPMTIKVSFLTQ